MSTATTTESCVQSLSLPNHFICLCVQRLLEVCTHAGVGDTVLISWNGMTAKEALALPIEVAKVVGDIIHCDRDVDDIHPISFVCPKNSSGALLADACKDGLCGHLEFPEMAVHVAAILQDEVQSPVKHACQMKLSLPNRCVPPNREGRYKITTFRAKRSSYGKPWYDTMRYRFTTTASADDGGVSIDGVGYGRCVCFYEDGSGTIGAILRCYNPFSAAVANGGVATRREHAPVLYDDVAQLAPLHLMDLNDRYSYIRVEANCILNGGFVLADPCVTNKYWIVQGHREKEIYLRHNGG
jgi:hypothetical protein